MVHTGKISSLYYGIVLYAYVSAIFCKFKFSILRPVFCSWFRATDGVFQHLGHVPCNVGCLPVLSTYSVECVVSSSIEQMFHAMYGVFQYSAHVPCNVGCLSVLSTYPVQCVVSSSIEHMFRAMYGVFQY